MKPSSSQPEQEKTPSPPKGPTQEQTDEEEELRALTARMNEEEPQRHLLEKESPNEDDLYEEEEHEDSPGPEKEKEPTPDLTMGRSLITCLGSTSLPLLSRTPSRSTIFPMWRGG